MLTAVCNLSTLQSQPTLDTMHKMHRLLGYDAKHPNAHQYIVPSDMILRIQSDAETVSEVKCGVTKRYVSLQCSSVLTSAPFFQGGPPGYFTHVSITTSIVSAWKNYYI